MYCRIVDGISIFPLYLVNINKDFFKDNFEMFELDYDNNCIICYNQREVDYIINKCQELNINYTMEDYIVEQSIKDKTKDIKYQSKTECLRHIFDNKEPEEQKIPNIKFENTIQGQEIVNKDLQILELTNENNILGNQIVDLELRLLRLESGV